METTQKVTPKGEQTNMCGLGDQVQTAFEKKLDEAEGEMREYKHLKSQYELKAIDNPGNAIKT